MFSASDEFEQSRIDKLHRIEALGLDPWGGRFDHHSPIEQVRSLTPNADPVVRARIAGRIVLRRPIGKLHFLTLWDHTGRIQIGINQREVPDVSWKLAQELDLGDLIGVEGRLGTTKTNELTLWADQVTILGKSLQPHPDKWAGMQDIEYRLRHRYLDLIYNAETLQRAKQRVLIVRTLRQFLDQRGFMEVETPTLHAMAGGAAARPFLTHHNALDIPLYLRIALELHLKRLLVGGLEKVYEIGRVFRNEGISPRHNPEFTMMELYQAYSDYQGMMDLTEQLILACVDALGSSRLLSFGDKTIDFTPPFQRASYAELLRKHADCDMNQEASVRAAAQRIGVDPSGKHPDVLIQHLFEETVEPTLSGPVFVYDYPASLCPLTKRKRDNPALAERFELFVHGLELANAYTELNDPLTQEAAFRLQLEGLPEDESMAKMDHDFIWALKHAMPPAGGLGIGIDRLTMLLTNTPTIRDVILFPLLRTT